MSLCTEKGNAMFNDDILAKCPECGASDTALTAEQISCGSCGFTEAIVVDAQTQARLKQHVAKALNRPKARDVLQRWNFAG
ncbi:MAG: hypothetical protein HRU31_12535 [Rhodobacteraceae bacterium]|nr:hypothetical protein [Paracoccaceae bacterium]